MEEIMTNEMVTEEAVEVATANPVSGLKVAVGIGVAALVGFGIYKLGKKIHEAIKAHKEKSEAIDADFEEVDSDGCDSKDAE